MARYTRLPLYALVLCTLYKKDITQVSSENVFVMSFTKEKVIAPKSSTNRCYSNIKSRQNFGVLNIK